MRRIQTVGLACALLIVGLTLSSCESLKKMVQNHPTMAKYEAKPNPLEMKGDKVKVEIKGEYQPKYFNKTAIVVMQPTIKHEGGSILMKPVILRGEKTKGQGTLISKTNGGNFTYSDEIAYSPEMGNCQLILNPVAYTEKKAKDLVVTNEEEASQVSKNVRLGETPLAKGTMITSTRIDKTETLLCSEEHKYEKETIISQEATIFFLVDMSNLNWNLPLNRNAESRKAIVALDSMLNTGMNIKSVNISAWASPEGEESRNQSLSDNRAKTGEKYFNQTYERIIKKRAKALKVKPDSLTQLITLNTESKGEDWDGFIADLRNSSIPDKNTIISVISSHTDKTSREQEIRNMTVIYKEIEDVILPSLRRGEITVHFLEPKKTDEQIAMYSLSSPDSLSLEELLYAATLTEDKEQQLSVYRSAVRIYPSDFRAYVNASSLMIKKGDYTEAQSLLETANGMNPNNPHIINNMGAISLAKGDFENAKSQFKNASCSEAQSNMGVIDIKEGNYSSAVSKLSSNKCMYNLALAQLLNGNIDEAKSTISCMNTATPESYYLLAVCAARQQNKAEAIDAMKKAVASNASFKAQAMKDVEFIKLSEEPEFQSILK